MKLILRALPRCLMPKGENYDHNSERSGTWETTDMDRLFAYATKWTRDQLDGKQPSRDLTNRKPYRTAAQKRLAREIARKVKGAWVSSAPVSYHK